MVTNNQKKKKKSPKFIKKIKIMSRIKKSHLKKKKKVELEQKKHITRVLKPRKKEQKSNTY